MMNTTSDSAMHMTGVSRMKRPATSGHKRVLRGKGPQSSATAQNARVRGVVKANLKGPYYA